MMGLFSWLKKGSAPAQASDASEAAPAAEMTSESVDELAEALASPDGAARVDASRALLDRWRGGDGRAAEALVTRLDELLEDKEPQVRIAALNAVRLMRKPDNLEKHASGVLALLADRSAQVRTAAVWTAARLPGTVAREQVRALLESEEEPMRFAAACALSDLRDAVALPQLVAALRQDYRRQEALSAVMSLGDAAALPAVAEVFDDEALGEFDRTLAAATLARLGDPRGAAYLADRVGSDGDDRPIAAEWAGRLGVTQAVPALEAVAANEADPARGAALRALGRLGATGAEERLVAVATSEEEEEDVRMDAAEGLAELGGARATAALRGLAEHPGELGALAKELLVEIADGKGAGEADTPAATPAGDADQR